MLPNDQLPEDLQYEDGPLPDAAAPDPLATIQDEHAGMLDELAPTPEMADPAALFQEHSQTLDELVPQVDVPDTPAAPLSQEAADANLAAPVTPPPKPYTPPSQRTYKNRQERRDEHARFLDQKAQDIEDFHLGEAEPLPADKGEGDKGNHPDMREVMDTATRIAETAIDWLADISRRLEALERRVESERM